jgi:hypothetical protein
MKSQPGKMNRASGVMLDNMEEKTGGKFDERVTLRGPAFKT